MKNIWSLKGIAMLFGLSVLLLNFGYLPVHLLYFVVKQKSMILKTSITDNPTDTNTHTLKKQYKQEKVMFVCI